MSLAVCLQQSYLHFLPFGDSWGVRSGTHPSACLPVRPHLSLSAKAFRGRPCKSVRQMGGRLFTCHLREAQATQSAAPNATCLNLVKPEWWINAAPCMAQILWRIPLYHVYLLPCSFRRTMHLLFIPGNKAGPWREHRLYAQTHRLTHRHAHKWASFCYWKVGNYG